MDHVDIACHSLGLMNSINTRKDGIFLASPCTHHIQYNSALWPWPILRA